MSWLSALPPVRALALALSTLAASGALSAHAQTPAKPHKAEDKTAPVDLLADQLSGHLDREIEASGQVQITRDQTRLRADRACYRQVPDEVEGQGQVEMTRFGDHYAGDAFLLNLDSGKGWVLNPRYKMELKNAQGVARKIEFLSDDEALVLDGTYSTCEGTRPDWFIKASRLRLDEGRDVGVATGSSLVFKGLEVPVPPLSFSLSGARRSGWLPPSIGGGSKGAFELALPYYFNIAPNRDLTVTPKMILRRGLQLNNLARYIGETEGGPYAGETQAEFLLNDKQTHSNRWYLNSRHSQQLMPGWSYAWSVKAASDDNYPTDFSKSISTSAERQLLRELRSDWGGSHWLLTARAQRYQVLQDPGAKLDPSLTVPRPYDRLPQVNLHTGAYDVNGFDWSLDLEGTRFWHPTAQQGNRALLIPQLSYPLIRPGWFVTPKLQLHASDYALDALPGKPSTSLTRVLPTFSLDSGLVFEKESTLFGRGVTQTLEPRLFYVYTPYKDQSAFPNFDSGLAGFSFAQVFSENRFLGNDRIGDANQVTAALVSRFIEGNGAERLKLALGQRFYFRPQRVTLDASLPETATRSDLLLAATGRSNQEWSFDSMIQYNASSRQVYSSSYGVQWQPGEKQVLNAAYRYLRDSFRNLDLSTQWPLSRRWYGVGRVSYSLRDSKILESLVGFEYKADCWLFRMGAQRFVTAAQHSSTPFFFQLELNGLSPVGFGNALESFYKGVPGYTKVNQGVTR
ncbi:LPS-assembly protein LptD [Massilia sp. TS11]|uniref:LPS-assembly protein LptD n=1 Tax=Massilia sp. TS11 TaxID=2908003 RepID=UPI001EDBB9FC|nr:LPS-assembly protein LptD [Massilia sp. TS11]MCG2586719.1 LPS-assembly protein LptD [Massilia sp. TS11]